MKNALVVVGSLVLGFIVGRVLPVSEGVSLSLMQARERTTTAVSVHDALEKETALVDAEGKDLAQKITAARSRVDAVRAAR